MCKLRRHRKTVFFASCPHEAMFLWRFFRSWNSKYGYRTIYRTSMQGVSCEVLLSPVVSRNVSQRKNIGHRRTTYLQRPLLSWFPLEQDCFKQVCLIPIYTLPKCRLLGRSTLPIHICVVGEFVKKIHSYTKHVKF